MTDPQHSRLQLTDHHPRYHHSSPDAADEDYCHALARRSVATAAQALGICTLQTQALATLADVLLEFLASLSAQVGLLAEASQRSSQHCHVLDAVRAVQHVCQRQELLWSGWDQSDFDDEDEFGAHFSSAAESAPEGSIAGQQSNSNGDPALKKNAALAAQRPSDPSYHGLAEFLFGSASCDPTATTAALVGAQQSPQRRRLSGAGKGAAPASAANLALRAGGAGGWQAPFALAVADFPAFHRSSSLRRPKNLRLSSSTTTSAAAEKDHDDDDEIIADSVWGLDTRLEKKRTADDMDVDEEPRQKRRKTADGSAGADDHVEQNTVDDNYPSFYPSLAEASSGRQQRPEVFVVDSDDKKTTNQDRSVRAALASAGWGSLSDEDAAVVPAGSTTSGSSAPVVVPLARASGSRVARILEGSMDASNI